MDTEVRDGFGNWEIFRSFAYGSRMWQTVWCVPSWNHHLLSLGCNRVVSSLWCHIPLVLFYSVSFSSSFFRCVSLQVNPSLIRNLVVFFFSFPFIRVSCFFTGHSLYFWLVLHTCMWTMWELLKFTEVSFFLHFPIFSTCCYSTVLIGVATWDTFNFKERWQCCKLHEYFQWICEENKSNRINNLKWWICEKFLFPFTPICLICLFTKKLTRIF